MVLKSQSASDASDGGFGLIEIMVSMFLLSLLAVAFLPVLLQGMKASTRNSTISTASQLLNAQIDTLRALGSTCSEVDAFDNVAPATSTDARGTVYSPQRSVGSCPVAYPGTVRVRVWVTDPGNSVLAEATTLFYVKSAAP